ncbi:hypothetical protein [Streptomyces sp. NBC_00009]|uniref:hypothetical protein n=1 Tax=Streptomyces sp. NBC_00009 TaxID=2975620 RepID=UPI00325112EB
MTGPALIGAVFAGLTLLPLIALAVTTRRATTRTVAHGTPDRTAPAARTTTDTASARS